MFRSKFFRRLLGLHLIAAALIGVLGCAYIFVLYQTLPPLVTVEDYKPSLVSEVYDRKGEKIGEFYREEVRLLIPYEDIPPMFVKAFMAAEDDTFFEHHGFNYGAILRAIWVNFVSGEKRQGASTITQQAARTVSLSLKKTYTRKIREALMTYKMEKNLSKEDILYLYLNQIYLGHGSYGIGAAAETFFRKDVKDLSLAEMAMVAGLPTSPERMNPIRHPDRAKARQNYVLNRMVEEGYITEEEAEEARSEIITVHTKKRYKRVGPYYVEMVRQLLFEELGENMVLEGGLKIITGMDFKAQEQAQKVVEEGLREIDKRRGYRGPKKTIDIKNEELVKEYLVATRDELIKEKTATLEIQPDGTTKELAKFEEFHDKDNNIPPYIEKGQIVEGLVTRVDDKNKVVYVSFAEGVGVIPLDDMLWAREFNPDLFPGEHLNISKPSNVLSPGYIIDVKVLGKVYKSKRGSKSAFEKYAHLALEQEPDLEAALLSFDMDTQDIIAMVGGYDYFINNELHPNSKYNRAVQATRQTGSGFKPIVYAAGLEQGLTPATPIMGAPIVLGGQPVQQSEAADKDQKKVDEDTDVWKPRNYTGKFTGDVLMRTALKRSLNTPTIRVLEKAGVSFAAEYARRLGLFSPLNMDFSMALGSSGTSVYEMTKAFSIFGNQGKRFIPILIREVQNHEGEVLLQNVSLDHRFRDQLDAIEQEFEQKRTEYEEALAKYKQQLRNRPIPEPGEELPEIQEPVNAFFFRNRDQLISPETAFLMTDMLHGVISEPDGTGGRAAELGHPAAGKTGTTSGYYDAWFLGYTAHASTTVWVGYDTEKTIGRGEAGGKAALPIWLEYMKFVHANKPTKSFDVPQGIVYAAVDKETGKASSNPSDSEKTIRIPFVEGTQPGSKPISYEEKMVEEKSFLKENF